MIRILNKGNFSFYIGRVSLNPGECKDVTGLDEVEILNYIQNNPEVKKSTVIIIDQGIENKLTDAIYREEKISDIEINEGSKNFDVETDNADIEEKKPAKKSKKAKA